MRSHALDLPTLATTTPEWRTDRFAKRNWPWSGELEARVIPHGHQLYDTVGDWRQYNDGTITVTSSQPGTHPAIETLDDAFAVCIHEIVEAYLCVRRGIQERTVRAFDLQFQAEGGDASDAGDDPRAPYHREHRFASAIEEFILEELATVISPIRPISPIAPEPPAP